MTLNEEQEFPSHVFVRRRRRERGETCSISANNSTVIYSGGRREKKSYLQRKEGERKVFSTSKNGREKRES